MKSQVPVSILFQKYKTFLYLLSVIITVIAAVVFYIRLEKIEEIIDLGMSAQARRNPKLAAQLFLQKSGMQVEGRSNLALIQHLPPVNDTLIISSSRKSISVYQYQKITDWVSKGGRLILTVQTLWDEDKNSSGDYFLDKLGVHQYLTPSGIKHTSKADSRKKGKERFSISKTIRKTISENQISSCTRDVTLSDLTKISFWGEDESLRVNFSDDFGMTDASGKAISEASSKKTTHFLQYHIGSGLITVLTDDWIWNNQQIHCFDHAYLLWQLTRGSRKTWLIYRAEIPGFFMLFFLNNHILVTTFFIMILLLILRFMFRFGPVIQTEDMIRRSLKDHIDASGMFYWKHKIADELIFELRKQIEHQLNLVHKDQSAQTEKEKYQYLSRKSHLPRYLIREALSEDQLKKKTVFTRIVKNLQILRKCL